jgi:hypothetical protein
MYVMLFQYVYILTTLHVEFSCWMLYLMIIMDVIYYIPASFKLGVRSPWEWHRRAETVGVVKDNTSKCVCNLCIKFIL